jgi:predicted nucleic acid-binding protein
MEIIFDSSPLIFLARLDFLEAALNLFETVSLPKAVADEIYAKHDQARRSIQVLIESHKLEIKETRLPFIADSLNKHLGRGEAATIALGVELQPDYVILDDSPARKEAMRLGLRVKGTLGIIKKLQETGGIRIENVDELYQTLGGIRFWVKRTLFDAIFKN